MFRTTLILLLVSHLMACGSRRTLAEAPHTLYIPFAAAHISPHGLKGLAVGDISHLEDLDALGVEWWYVWAWFTEMGATPMLREMQDPPTCEPFILVGNEPDAVEPYGHPVTPADAAQRVLAIELACPNSLLIAGNVTGDGYTWLASFLENYRSVTGHEYTGGLGVHCYTWAKATYCIERLAGLRALYAGPMWLTEFNVLQEDPNEFAALVDYAAATFDRYAVFTNRQVPGNPSLPYAALIGDDGVMGERGLVYADR